MSVATEISRLQTAKADIKTAIQNKGVVVPSSEKIDTYPTYIGQIQASDPYEGHDYVEIGGIKWATMNIGASSITDRGLYFQWGDTTGYAASQIGTNEEYKKPADWYSYKFSGGRDDPSSDTYITKYNTNDGKTVLDLCDDAVRANWGGQWRMPTVDEFNNLINNTTHAWVTNYNGSGVNGMLFTSNADGKTLFFPNAAVNGGSGLISAYYWGSTLYRGNNYTRAYSLRCGHPRENYTICETDYEWRSELMVVRGVIG